MKTFADNAARTWATSSWTSRVSTRAKPRMMTVSETRYSTAIEAISVTPMIR